MKKIDKYSVFTIIEDTDKLGNFSQGSFNVYVNKVSKEIVRVEVSRIFKERESRKQVMINYIKFIKVAEFDIVISSIENHREDFLTYRVLGNKDEHSLCEQLKEVYENIDNPFNRLPNFKESIVKDDSKDVVKYRFSSKVKPILYSIAFAVDAVKKDKVRDLRSFFTMMNETKRNGVY